MKTDSLIEAINGIKDDYVTEYDPTESAGIGSGKVISMDSKRSKGAKGGISMKKIHVILIAAVVCLLAGTAAFAAISARNRQEVNMFNAHDVNVEQTVEDGKVPEGEGKLGEVPVYAENDLLYYTEGYELNRDFSFWYNQNAHMTYTGRILKAYPDPAIRERADNTLYFVYDTDTGYRLYLFFTKENDLQDPIGFPVVIKELLSHKDFESLKVGDTISDVAGIDPVAEVYRKKIIEIWNLQPKGAASQAAKGYPCTSIHYLKDGILKIEYEMTEERELIIKNIVFSENYKLTDVRGNTIDYRIVDGDLPK